MSLEIRLRFPELSDRALLFSEIDDIRGKFDGVISDYHCFHDGKSSKAAGCDYRIIVDSRFGKILRENISNYFQNQIFLDFAELN